MKYESIADIYSANQMFRERLVSTLDGISADEESVRPEGEKWSIRQVVEHVSMVEVGVSRICSTLLDRAKTDGKGSDGSFSLSESFGASAAKIATAKVEAPERVQPTGEVSISDALARIKAATTAITAMRSELEAFDLSGHTFPHPFFGELTAAEWLVVAGLHERRHTQQIDGLLAKVRQ